MAVTMVIAGLGSLIGGGQLSVSRAVRVAEGFGVPAGVIGLTVIAVGTSLPELATSVVATWKGQTDLAVGNVVGSNIFNLLFILGTTAVLRPVEVPPRGATDLLVLAAFSVALLLMCASHRATVRRWEGGVLLVAYGVYIVWRAG
jgi:cation:H+ antiporter